MQSSPQSELGMVGLGVMGQNMLLNMSDHGYVVAGYDKDPGKVDALQVVAKDRQVYGTHDIKQFVEMLRQPRVVMLLVPAGQIVDAVIQDFLPFLEPGDLIIDAGNSYFQDTDRRSHDLKAKGIEFMGVGVSGGEKGARHGPSIMPGGSKQAYERVRPLFEAIAAKVNKDPCVTYIGPGSAGHFVKMVHNGIEYGIMQLISETYDLMKRGLGLNNDQLHDVYEEWNKGELNSYLIEITSYIFKKIDDKSSNRLIDEILDVAAQKGTGMWTSQTAMELQVPVPTIDSAVMLRDLSGYTMERAEISALYHSTIQPLKVDRKDFILKIRDALLVGMIMTYTQGMALLSAASAKYNYDLNLEAIARIWRGGCIIRAEVLEDIRTAYIAQPSATNLLLDPILSQRVIKHQKSLREVVCQASNDGIPISALMASLSYLDAFCSGWLPANLIQAQRDYFGSHTYELINMKGSFHTDWEE
jgi:6-phosphogluconate dehydrogenase